MSNRGPTTLWWVEDNQSGSFSTLPTGPFFLPALIVVCAFYLYRACFGKNHTHKSVATYLVHSEEWQAKYKRYKMLIKRSVQTNNNLDYLEIVELRSLERYLNNPHNIK